ncbi:hypothetical protein [Lentzea sp. NEAU-D7]|nr:hypothetical protein [Lentzea sp. NEAU-D7]MCX2948946.1 hypothetical protein [Lentzea sp. NEAU-D7]
MAAARDHVLIVLGDRWTKHLGRALDDAALVAFAGELPRTESSVDRVF